MSQSLFSPVCFAFLWILLRLLRILISSRVIQGRWVLAVVYHLGMLMLIKVVRHSWKKVQFMSISCELGSMSKYSRFSLYMSSLRLSQSADL